MSLPDRIADALEHIAKRLDSIDAKLEPMPQLAEDVANMKVRVLLTTADYDGELEQLNKRVRDLETGRQGGLNGAE